MLYYYKMTTTTEKYYYKLTDARDSSLLLMGCSKHPTDKRLEVLKAEAKTDYAMPYVNIITSNVGWDNVNISSATQSEHAAYVKSTGNARRKEYNVDHKEEIDQRRKEVSIAKRLQKRKAYIYIYKTQVILVYYGSGCERRRSIRCGFSLVNIGEEAAVKKAEDKAKELKVFDQLYT
jgi:hypothetical protein